MKRHLSVITVLFLVVTFCSILGRTQTASPLTLIQTIELPDIPSYPYAGDVAVDVKRHRLFVAAQGSKSMVVVELGTSKVIYTTPVEYAHSIFYLRDLDQVYVGDGGVADPGVKIYDGGDYHLIKSIKLLARTDAFEYDPETKFVYVVNGGAAAKMDHSMITIIDSVKGEIVGEIKVPGKTLESMVLEPASRRLYITVGDGDRVEAVDVRGRSFIEAWPVTKGTDPTAVALDEKHHRLFVATRTSDMRGYIVVFDTQTKKEVAALPTGGKIHDGLVYDAPSRRLYVACGSGEIDVYQQRDPDHYTLLSKTDTGILARSGLLVPEMQRYFSSVPHLGAQSAKILIFQTH